jgi:hypothetical protein
MTSTSYDNIKDQLRPFDLLLFRGGEFVSKLIRRLEQYQIGNGEFSHVGLIVTKDVLPFISQLEDGKLYVLESTFSFSIGNNEETPDIVTGKGRFGVQIRDLQSVVRTYTSVAGAKMAWAPLINNPWLDEFRRPHLIRQMTDIYNRYGRNKYEVNCLDLFASLFPCLRNTRRRVYSVIVGIDRIITTNKITSRQAQSKYLFCSEFVGLVYVNLGIIQPSFNPSDMVPVDFLGYDQDGMPRIVDTITYLQP